MCGVAAALVVGCGDRSNLVPPSDAQSIKDALSQARSAIDDGRCALANAAVARARSAALDLPAGVDRRLRSRINDGIQALQTTGPRDCEAAAAAQTQTQATTETQTTETQTTPTETQTTETTPTETQATPTDTVPTTTTPTTPTETQTTTTDGTSPDTGGSTGEAPAP